MSTSLLSILEFVGFCLTSLTCSRHRSQSSFVFLFLGCGLLVPVLHQFIKFWNHWNWLVQLAFPWNCCLSTLTRKWEFRVWKQTSLVLHCSGSMLSQVLNCCYKVSIILVMNYRHLTESIFYFYYSQGGFLSSLVLVMP